MMSLKGRGQRAGGGPVVVINIKGSVVPEGWAGGVGWVGWDDLGEGHDGILSVMHCLGHRLPSNFPLWVLLGLAPHHTLVLLIHPAAGSCCPHPPSLATWVCQKGLCPAARRS